MAIELLAFEDLPISFDAQTRFFHFMPTAPLAATQPYRTLGVRFSFARDAFDPASRE